jgi:replicative DNA helicase
LKPDYLNAEYSVIGSLLIDAEYALPALSAILQPEDFTIDLNREIYKAALELRNADACIDPVTIRQKLGKDETDDISRFMMDCMEITTTAAYVENYAKIVKDASLMRSISETALTIQDMVREETDSMQTLGYAVDTFSALMADGTAGELVSSMEAATDFYEYRNQFEKDPEKMFVKTGFNNLDWLLGGGMVNSGFYVIAARPGTGKTTIALNIADNIAERGFPVLFVSLEMSVKQITAKRLARQCGVPYRELLMSKLTDDQYLKMSGAAAKIAKLPMTVNRKAGATIPQIESMARKVKGIRLVVVDYLGLIQPASRRKTRYEETTEISGALKTMAIRLGIPILCLAQLNRENEKEKGRKPKLHHLRDTGAIEQDGDAVILLHQEERDPELPAWEGTDCECIVAKNRHGETGITNFSFYGAQAKFVPVMRR